MKTSAVNGFTLLEVLVALAIIGFGLLAVFGQINQSVSSVTHLRDKTLAHWVAEDRITEIRLNQDFPPLGTRSDNIDMANSSWRYSVNVSATQVEDLRRIDVGVAHAETPDRVLDTMTGFVVLRPKPGVIPAERWDPPTQTSSVPQSNP